MAPSVGETSRVRYWLGQLGPDAERLEFATRLALICSLTTLLTAIYQTPEPALSAYVAFFMNRAERMTSVVLSIVFTLIIGILVGLVIVIANFVVDDPMWRVISIAVISFLMLYVGSASRLQPIAGTLALIVAYGLDLLGRIQVGELATRGLLYLWLLIAIPAAVSVVVNLILAPSPRRTAARAIADRLTLCAVVLRNPLAPERQILRTQVRMGMASILSQIRLAGVEKTATASDVAVLERAALSCFGLMSAVDLLAANSELDVPDPVRAKLADTTDELASLVQQGHYPPEVTVTLPDAGHQSPLVSDVVAAMREAALHFAARDIAKHALPESKKEGFWSKDAFSNPEHAHYALKTTAAAVFCYVLYSLLDWPGIHTCFLTCYIVAQTTAAESVEKLSLRLIGCLVGAAAGIASIVFLMPSVTSVGGLMAVAFTGAWLCSYVAAGSPRVSYAGFQMAFAFFLCVIQGSGPAFDLVVARDRVIGIIIGNLVAYFVFVYLWPVTVSRRVDSSLAAAFSQMAAAASMSEPRERWRLASQAQGTLGQAEGDIELAHYEPAPIGSGVAWLDTRQHVLKTARSLAALVAVTSDPRELSRAATAARLQTLAARLSRPSHAVEASPRMKESDQGWQTLSARVNGSLGALEDMLGSDAGNAATEANPNAHP